MQQVNMHEAKSNLSRLVDSVVNGEEVVIAKAGKPLARLVPYKKTTKERKPGMWRGQIAIGEDFDSLPDEIALAFQGKVE